MFSDSRRVTYPFHGDPTHEMKTTHLLAEWMEMKHRGEPQSKDVPDPSELNEHVSAFRARFNALEREINRRVPMPL